MGGGGGGGGKGRWTNSAIDGLTVFYGGAIRNFPGNVDGMHRAILAVFHHSLSSDAEHNHQFCPSGSDSWCKFNRALANDENHPSTPLSSQWIWVHTSSQYLLSCPSWSFWRSVCWERLRIRMSPSITSSGPGAPRLDFVL